jgi:hypothetical protein
MKATSELTKACFQPTEASAFGAARLRYYLGLMVRVNRAESHAALFCWTGCGDLRALGYQYLQMCLRSGDCTEMDGSCDMLKCCQSVG